VRGLVSGVWTAPLASAEAVTLTPELEVLADAIMIT
jgi:hypothetical protein